MKLARIKKFVLWAYLSSYLIITIFPFYVLFVRSFVATRETTELHMWIPGKYEVSEKMKVWNAISFLQMKKDELVEGFGVEDPSIIKNTMTLKDISEKTGISIEVIKDHLSDLYRYHGWIYAALNVEFFRATLNSLIITSTSVVLLIFLSILSASVIAGFRKRWHFHIYSLYMVSLVVTPTFIFVPKFILINYLHLMNTYWALILPFAAGNALSTMIFTNYIATIPKELAESVYVDGGNRLHYLFRIIFPLSAVPIGSIMVIQLPLIWNNFLEAMLFLNDETKYTIQVYLRSFIGSNTDDFQAMFVTVLLSIIPMILMYLFSRKLFIKTLLSGAIKG